MVQTKIQEARGFKASTTCATAALPSLTNARQEQKALRVSMVGQAIRLKRRIESNKTSTLPRHSTALLTNAEFLLRFALRLLIHSESVFEEFCMVRNTSHPS